MEGNRGDFEAETNHHHDHGDCHERIKRCSFQTSGNSAKAQFA